MSQQNNLNEQQKISNIIDNGHILKKRRMPFSQRRALRVTRGSQEQLQFKTDICN